MARAANATAFLREHPDVTQSILQRIQAQLGDDQIASASCCRSSSRPTRRRPRRRGGRGCCQAEAEAEVEEAVVEEAVSVE